MQKALDRYYKKIIEYGEQYRMLTHIALKSDVALQVDEVLDQIEYYTKIYYFTWKYKRKLTAEEVEHFKFRTPESNSIKYFHAHRSYRPINEPLRKLIVRVKEIQKEMSKENEKDNKIPIQYSINLDNASTSN